MIQSEPAELEWDLEPGLDAVTADVAEGNMQAPRQGAESQQGIYVLHKYSFSEMLTAFVQIQQ